MDGVNSVIAMDSKGANLCESLTFLLINLSIIVRDKIREKDKIE